MLVFTVDLKETITFRQVKEANMATHSLSVLHTFIADFHSELLIVRKTLTEAGKRAAVSKKQIVDFRKILQKAEK